MLKWLLNYYFFLCLALVPKAFFGSFKTISAVIKSKKSIFWGFWDHGFEFVFSSLYLFHLKMVSIKSLEFLYFHKRKKIITDTQKQASWKRPPLISYHTNRTKGHLAHETQTLSKKIRHWVATEHLYHSCYR